MKRTPFYIGLWLVLIAQVSNNTSAQEKPQEFKGQSFETLTGAFDTGDLSFSPDTKNNIDSRTGGSPFLSKLIKVPLKEVTPFLSFSTSWTGSNLSKELLNVEVRYSTSTEADLGEWSTFSFNKHVDHTSEKLTSELLELPKEVRYVQLRVVIKKEGQLVMPNIKSVSCFFYSPGDTPESTKKVVKDNAKKYQRTNAACTQPAYVTRSQWGAIPRSAAPSSNVTHLIVHHEAGSNTSSDWAARVRSVQNFHIFTNGWSDIGYNFLVDPNGVVYEGRAGGDNAIGAHFCGSNGNTMAVCMLGTYTSVTPTSSAQDKLVELLSWKTNKEGIDPLGSSFKSGVGTIPNISGHRAAGCSICPGDALFGILPTIRSRANAGCSSGGGGDTTPPTTAMTARGGTFQSGDFTVDFSDSDNIGVTRQYYQVLEWTNNEWRGNKGNGFFNDNYQDGSLHPDYLYSVGSWAENNNHLVQSNTSISNTILSAQVDQNSGLPYMYQFSAKVSATGNQKMGIHIMADQYSSSQRNNSYLVWFDGDFRVLIIYEAVNNLLYERTRVPLDFDRDWADYKITYSPSYGVMQVWRNNSLLTTYTDPTPISNGNYISLRTNSTAVEFDDLKVYKYRISSAVTVTAGPGSDKDARTESPNGVSASCKVKSMVHDNAGNWSAPGNLDVVLQWSTSSTSSGNPFRFVVSPNPTEQDNMRLYYELPESSPIKIDLYDGRGTFVSTLVNEDQQAGQHATEFLLSDYKLDRGIYFIKFYDKNGRHEGVKLLVH